jgi:hypothetical protein
VVRQVGEAIEAQRDVERKLRLLEREIMPLIVGVEDRTKAARLKRLRDRVRLQYRSARRIQATYRGWRLRKAMFSWYRDYWIQVGGRAGRGGGFDHSGGRGTRQGMVTI